MKNILSVVSTVVLVLVGVFYIVPREVIKEGVKENLGNVESASGGYNATTTGSTWENVCLPANARSRVLKNGPGVLGSVNIWNETIGQLILVDATTTNINLRTGNYPTTTVMNITIPASLAEGSYPFNTTFNYGLIAVCTGSSNVASSTITWQ